MFVLHQYAPPALTYTAWKDRRLVRAVLLLSLCE
jgi:hypothetical protein